MLMLASKTYVNVRVTIYQFWMKDRRGGRSRADHDLERASSGVHGEEDLEVEVDVVGLPVEHLQLGEFGRLSF